MQRCFGYVRYFNLNYRSRRLLDEVTFALPRLQTDLSRNDRYRDDRMAMVARRGLRLGNHLIDGSPFRNRASPGDPQLVYTIGRSSLLELFHTELQSDQVRFADTPVMRRAFEQLANLEAEYREGGAVYTRPQGKHDDLGISGAMLAWAARHPHLEAWMRNLEAARRPRRPQQRFGWGAFV
jgi:hypothetical protein